MLTTEQNILLHRDLLLRPVLVSHQGLLWIFSLVKIPQLRDSDVDRATRFIEQIQEIHQAVQEQLEKSQAKYKDKHDKHRMEHSFQAGDQV